MKTALALVSLSIGFLACGEEPSPSNNSSSSIAGQPCATVSTYQCEGNVLYRCKFDMTSEAKTWEVSANCAASPTQGCHCASVSGNPICATADNQGSCEGT